MSGDPSELLERDDVQRARRFIISHWPHMLLLLIALLTFVTRINGWENYVTANGTVQFGGNDGWYHYREVKYIVQNWPATMPFDPWTGYPTGQSAGQFGTFFDQLVATVALIIGLGSPSDNTIRLVLLFTPPVFGMLTVFPTYYIATRLSGDRRIVGVAAALFLAMSPGTFYSRTIVGLPDHNAAEPFFLLLMISAFIGMVLTLRDDPLVLELFTGDLEDIPREPVLSAVLFGVTFAMFVWIWPPAVLFGGVLAVVFVLYGFRTYTANNAAPEPVFIGSLIGLAVTLLMVLPFTNFGAFFPSQIGLSHLATLLLLAAIAGGFIGAARLQSKRDIPKWVLPIAAIFVVIVGTTALRVAIPDVFGAITGNIMNVFGLGLGGGEQAVISEAQSLTERGRPLLYLLGSYGFLFVVAQLGIAATIYNGLVSEDNPIFILLGVMAFFVQLMAFTQIRFNYYHAAFVAIFAAYTLDYVIRLLEIPDSFPSLRGYQILMVMVIFLIVLPFIFIPVAGSSSVFAPSQGADREYTSWKPTLEWMENNTPEEGQLENPDEEPLEYYGSYDKADDYNYEDGAYGVMSWWDYGHWITTTSERIPVANPFQQHAQTASEYLLAPSEEEAQQSMNDLNSEGQTRYVVVNWQMVNEQSEFPAITVFHPNDSYREFSQPVYAQEGNGVRTITSYRQDRFYESLATRLYYYHGSKVPESRATFSIQQRQNVAVTGQPGGDFATFHESPGEAERFAASNQGEVQGGIGIFAPESEPALEHYRLVRASEEQAVQNPRYRALSQQQSRATGVSPNGLNPYPSTVKVFERVPGATIQGSGPANENVTVSVLMETHYGQRFVYLQETQTDENGEFNVTVPYSTTGYDNLGPEQGYTNTSTKAVGEYQIAAATENGSEETVWTARTDVSEAKVVGEDTSAATVTLEPQESPPDDQTSNEST